MTLLEFVNTVSGIERLTIGTLENNPRNDRVLQKVIISKSYPKDIKHYFESTFKSMDDYEVVTFCSMIDIDGEQYMPYTTVLVRKVKHYE